jgi:hypothetical protein
VLGLKTSTTRSGGSTTRDVGARDEDVRDEVGRRRRPEVERGDHHSRPDGTSGPEDAGDGEDGGLVRTGRQGCPVEDSVDQLPATPVGGECVEI